MASYKDRFNDDDRRLLSISEQLKIESGRLSEEEISSLISSRLQNVGLSEGQILARDSEANINAALDEAFPTKPPEEVAPLEPFSALGLTPMPKAPVRDRGTLGESFDNSALQLGYGLSGKLAGGVADAFDLTDMALRPIDRMLGSDPREVGGASRNLREKEAYANAQAKALGSRVQDYNEGIENDALRFGAKSTQAAVNLIPSVVSRINPAFAALPAAQAGIQAYGDRRAEGSSKAEAAFGAGMMTLSEFLMERMMGGKGGILKTAGKEAGQEMTTTGVQNVLTGAEAALVNSKASALLPKTYGELAEEVGISGVVGSVGGAGFASVDSAVEAVGNRILESEARAAEAAKFKNAARRQALRAFTPVGTTGVDPDFDAGIKAANQIGLASTLESKLKDAPVTTTFDDIPAVDLLRQRGVALGDQQDLDIPLQNLTNPEVQQDLFAQPRLELSSPTSAVEQDVTDAGNARAVEADLAAWKEAKQARGEVVTPELEASAREVLAKTRGTAVDQVPQVPSEALGATQTATEGLAVPTLTPVEEARRELPREPQQQDLFDDPSLQQESNTTRDMFSGELAQRESPPTAEARANANTLLDPLLEQDRNRVLGVDVSSTPPNTDVAPTFDGVPVDRSKVTADPKGVKTEYNYDDVDSDTDAVRTNDQGKFAVTFPESGRIEIPAWAAPTVSTGKAVAAVQAAVVAANAPSTTTTTAPVNGVARLATKGKKPRQTVKGDAARSKVGDLLGTKQSILTEEEANPQQNTTTNPPPRLLGDVEVRTLITEDKSEFGEIARRGIASGRVRLVTKAEAKVLRPKIRDGVRGWYGGENGNTIFIVSDAQGDDLHPVALIAHEVTHAGLQQFKAKNFPKYAAAVRALAASGNKTAIEAVREATAQIQRGVADGVPYGTQARIDAATDGEIVAYATHLTVQARDGGKPLGRVGSLVRQILSDTKALLVDIGVKDPSFLTLDDIVRMSAKNADKFFKSAPDGKAKLKTAVEMAGAVAQSQPKVASPATPTASAPTDPNASADLPALRLTNSGIQIADENVNVSKKENAEIARKGKITDEQAVKEVITGKTLGQVEPLIERASGVKTAAIHKVTKTVERLQMILKVTPEMIAGVRSKNPIKRVMALRKIKALPRGKEAYLLTVGLLDDMRQMSYNAGVLASKAKRLPDGRIDPSSLSDSAAKLLLNILENIDSYAARSYEVFMGPKHKKQRQDDTWGDYSKGIDSPGAKAFKNAVDSILTQELLLPDDPAWPASHKKSVARMYEMWGYDPRGKTHEQMVKQLQELKATKSLKEMQAKALLMAQQLVGFNEEGTKTIYQYYSKVGLDRSNLKKKQSVPKYARELWGEVKDPWFKLTDSYVVLAQLTSGQQLLNQLAEVGKRQGILAKKGGNTNTDLSEPIDGDQYGDLNKMVTTPAFYEIIKATVTAQGSSGGVAEALRNGDVDAANKKLLERTLDRWTGTVRHAKAAVLILTPVAYLINLVGSPLFPLASGNLNLKHLVGGLKDAWQTVRARIPGAIPNGSFVELIQGGVVDGVITGDVRDHEAQMLNKMIQRSLGKADAWHAKATRNTGRMFKELFGVARDVYATMDLWSKFANYRYEKAYIKEEHAARGVKITEDQIQMLAADRTNRTNPTYGRASPLARAIDKGGIWPFFTFMAEIPRIYHNNIKLGVLDMAVGQRDGNGVRFRNGAKRVSGSLVSLGLGTKLIGATGVIAQGMISNAFSPDEEDEELTEIFGRAWDSLWSIWGADSEDEDLAVRGGLMRREGADLIRLDDVDGKARFISSSRFDPRNMLTEGVVAALRKEGTPMEKVNAYIEAAFVGLENGVSRPIFTGALKDGKSNVQRDAPENFAGIVDWAGNVSGGRVMESHVNKVFNVFDVIRPINQVLGAKEEYEKGKAYEAEGDNDRRDERFLEMWNKVGGKIIVEFDPVKATSTNIMGIYMEDADMIDESIKSAGRPGISEETATQMMLAAEDARFKAYNRARPIIVAAEAMDMTKADIITNLKSSGMKKEDIRALVAGTFKTKKISNNPRFMAEKATSDKDPKDLKAKQKEAREKVKRALSRATELSGDR